MYSNATNSEKFQKVVFGKEGVSQMNIDPQQNEDF